MNQNISKIRKEIDTLDEQLVSIIARRIFLVKKIGKIKKRNNFPILDTRRREEVKSSYLKSAEKMGIPQKTIEGIFRLIHKYSLIIERDI